MMTRLSQSRCAGLLLLRLPLPQLLAWPRQARLAAALLPDPADAAALAQRRQSAAAALQQRGWLSLVQQQLRLAAEELQHLAPALQQTGSACFGTAVPPDPCHCCRQLSAGAALQRKG